MTRNRPRSEQGQRQLRVGEMLRKALSDVLIRAPVEDPDLSGVTVTVSQVTLSPDLRQATAFVMPLGGSDQSQVVAALERHRKFVRGELAKRVTLKYMPTMTFKLDETFDEVERIERLLRSPKVAQDIE
jgi:ribosome-binding factor A